MTTTPTVTDSRKISAIWLLPFIALCICGWLLYTSYKNAGVDITIVFADASGIEPGKTRVMSRGIPVGLVRSIIPDLEHKQVKAQVEMDQEVAQYLVEDTLFWVVRPELSASSIEGLDTILSGSYIEIRPGTSTTPRREFNCLESAPPVSPDTPGLHVQLRAEELGSIQVGTGVYYRNVQIGSVQHHRLVRDESIMIDLFIDPDFQHLVREGSRFCNASGVLISGKLPNLKIQIESLASLLRGGILLHTPQQLQETPRAENGHVFSLYPDYESANYGIPMTLTLASSEDIVEGSTKVMYRGLEAGFVKEIRINNDERRTVTAHILLDPRAELILRENTTFWLVKPEISPGGINNLRLLLSGAHITFQPGDGGFKNHFTILSEPPPQTPLRAGNSYTLVSHFPSDISVNSPVYYKNIQVGKVIDIRLVDEGQTIETQIFIYREHLHLISPQSVFWTSSGLSVAASLTTGLSMKTGPLAQMIYGGVSFTTPSPEGRRIHMVPKENHVFRLHKSYLAARETVASLQPQGISFQLTGGDAPTITIGAPILYKKIAIGEVRDIRLTEKNDDILIDCFVDHQYAHLIRGATRFFRNGGIQLSAGLGGINIEADSLTSIIAGGIGCLTSPTDDSPPLEAPYPLYTSRRDAELADSIELTFYFTSGDGIKKGTEIRYRGIVIGHVTELELSDELYDIIGKIHIKPIAARLFKTNTRVWLEETRISLSGVTNPSAAVFGPHLNILPGDGPLSNTFIVLEEPPLTAIAERTGLGLILETPHLGSLATGSPVYYRQVQIGQVTGWKLSKSFQKVLVFVAIDTPYSAIVRENTRFWNVSGTRIEGGLFSGLSIATESLTAFLRGGIALATPDNERTGPPVSPGHHFLLADKPQPEWLDWSPDVTLLQQEEGPMILHK